MLEGLAAEGGDELLVDDLDDLLGRVERLGELGAEALLADARDEAADDREVDVGLEQGEADLAQHLVDVGLAEAALAAEPLKMPSKRSERASNMAGSEATG